MSISNYQKKYKEEICSAIDCGIHTLQNLTGDRKDHICCGSKNPLDEMIISDIEERIQKGDKPRILELAAGTSYPTEYIFFGAPWLSRGIAAVYKDRVSIIASDIEPETKFGFILFEEVLGYRMTKHHKDNFKLPINRLIVSGKDASFEPLNQEELKTQIHENSYLYEKQLRTKTGVEQKELFFDLCIATSETKTPSPHKEHHNIYVETTQEYLKYVKIIRPIVDIEMEKKLFNLDMCANVSFKDSSQIFKDYKFDIIFCRGLNPTAAAFNEHLLQEKDNLKNLLAPNGKFFLSGDWNNASKGSVYLRKYSDDSILINK